MAAYVFANNGLPLFDTTGAIIPPNYVFKPVNHIGNVANITTFNGLPYYWASPPRAIIQLDMQIQVNSLI